MQHRRVGRKFGRVRSQRRALVKTMLGSFFLRGKMKTTEAKAKELKSMIDRIITQAKKAKDAAKKVAVIRELRKRLPVVTAEKVVGMQEKFEGRSSGFTRIIKLGQRKSDGSKMAVIELIQ